MNLIDPNSAVVKVALKTHCNRLVDDLIKRCKKLSNRDLEDVLDREFILKILKVLPEDLMSVNDEFYNSLKGYSLKGYNTFKSLYHKKYNALLPKEKNNRTKYLKLNSLVAKIFTYTKWFDIKDDSKKYRAYNLAQNLKINTCVYCNRLYTNTVISKGNGEKISRPEFDHWYIKSKYPLLALSFYNLIPSCHVCNSSVKGREEFSIETHLHPYSTKSHDIRFSFDFKSYNTYEFKIKSRTQEEENTINSFKLKDIYETHIDEMIDLVKIKRYYSDNYLNNLTKMLTDRGVTISGKEMYRLAFGVYLDEKEFEKRPMSRMKRDILKELGII